MRCASVLTSMSLSPRRSAATTSTARMPPSTPSVSAQLPGYFGCVHACYGVTNFICVPLYTVLQSRMLPSWVLDAHFHDASANRTVTYAELCPKTPLLFL